MKLSFKGSHNEFRELVCRVLGCSKPHKPVRVWTIAFESDVPIPKGSKVKLSKPIKPGFRRPFTITPDEAVDKREDGSFLGVEFLSGDSTVTIDPSSTATSLKGWLNGDGATGAKAVRFIADGHVGDGDQPVTLDVEFDVANPDATSLAAFVEGADEPIPT